MLVTPATNRRNRNHALALTGLMALLCGIAALLFIPALIALCFCPLVYWFVRRRCLRRLKVMSQPFPRAWEQVLQANVAFFRALSDPEKDRFRGLVQVFLDEVQITGIRTEIDDTVRVLVAASAVIPIFGFQDWEYHRLGEVLVYPGSFDEKYQTKGDADEDTLGMVGLKHLSGVMILSKPSLIEGFTNPSTHDHVGVHEFAHLIEDEVADHGLPPEVSWRSVKHWVQYVADELAHAARNHAYINGYAYTNEHEFFAVLAEYFFKSPHLLQEKDPQLYAMLREMFHQDTASILNRLSAGRQRYDGNAPCPCGSGNRFKDCCLLNTANNGIK